MPDNSSNKDFEEDLLSIMEEIHGSDAPSETGSASNNIVCPNCKQKLVSTISRARGLRRMRCDICGHEWCLPIPHVPRNMSVSSYRARQAALKRAREKSVYRGPKIRDPRYVK